MRSSGMFKVVFGIVILIMAYHAFLFGSAMMSGEKVYVIDVNKFNEIETYYTTQYTIDENKCIFFKEIYGFKRKHIVCNNYTITEY